MKHITQIQLVSVELYFHSQQAFTVCKAHRPFYFELTSLKRWLFSSLVETNLLLRNLFLKSIYSLSFHQNKITDFIT